MLANYHTHTFRCNHADGTEREYIETAIARGLKTLGFSDHTPYPFEEKHYSNFRMRIADLEGYFTTLRALKKEYEKEINILIGFEAEYYPDYFEKLLQIITPFGYDYLIMGQHFIGNEMHEPYVAAPTGEKKILTRYVNQCIEGLKTGKFLYLAHPDLPNFTGDEAFYRQEMMRLCQAAKQLNVPLEYNLLGLAGGRNYPSNRFFKLAAAVGNQVVLGCDAHTPGMVAKPELLLKAEQNLAALGLTAVSELTV